MAATRDRTRNVLVAAEVALALTLLVGAGLLIRSAMLVQRVDPGFDPRGVLAARLMLPQQRYPDGAATVRAYSQILDEAKRIPGVGSAAIVSVVPLSGSQMHSLVNPDGAEPDANTPQANLRLASAGYFATMGIPLRAGRDLSAQDVAGTPPVVVINEALAKKLWPTLPPSATLGHRINAMSAKRSDPHDMEVVGVVGDLHDTALSQAPVPEFYAPFEQTPDFLWPFIQRSLVVVVRSRNVAAAPETLVRPLERAVANVDQSLPLAEARSMESFLSSSLQTAKMNTLLLSTLGGIALVLAVVGIYGVVSYFVSQRTHEIGVRMALGASPKIIWQFVLCRGFTPIVLGMAIGLVLSALTTTVLRGQLYRISNHDPATISAVAVLLVLVALLATVGPARRAMRISPLRALNDG